MKKGIILSFSSYLMWKKNKGAKPQTTKKEHEIDLKHGDVKSTYDMQKDWNKIQTFLFLSKLPSLTNLYLFICVCVEKNKKRMFFL